MAVDPVERAPEHDVPDVLRLEKVVRESGLDPATALPGQTVGEFHLVQEGLVRAIKANRSLISAEQVPFDRIEQLAAETRGLDERQLRLFDLR